ncbi:hypothetical protein [uncultured Aquimarina sp.]|uniref:hypothetical protein n=1 Tax=uncultured Aquimarina sp. TaxID=575652 RepID=UPI002607E690|nr:hypothetical protein [uncultured Aquimarina sp.]
MATVTVKGATPISENQRSKALQYMSDNLNDDELGKLFLLAKSPEARKALVQQWSMITSFLM